MEALKEVRDVLRRLELDDVDVPNDDEARRLPGIARIWITCGGAETEAKDMTAGSQDGSRGEAASNSARGCCDASTMKRVKTFVVAPVGSASRSLFESQKGF